MRAALGSILPAISMLVLYKNIHLRNLIYEGGKKTAGSQDEFVNLGARRTNAFSKPL